MTYKSNRRVLTFRNIFSDSPTRTILEGELFIVFIIQRSWIEQHCFDDHCHINKNLVIAAHCSNCSNSCRKRFFQKLEIEFDFLNACRFFYRASFIDGLCHFYYQGQTAVIEMILYKLTNRSIK